ncbi:MAG: DUF177 domain-containing protein [Chloroflexi bacterium]|nr:DUF177 domain-containing protein [Chloroflexota bacterium]
MKINVAQQLKESVGSTRKYVIHEKRQAMDVEVNPQVDGVLNFLRTDKGILVTGVLDTYTKCICGRCLEEFEQLLKLKIEEEYYPTVDVVTGLPSAQSTEEGAFTIDENHILDLSEAVRQYVIMAISLKPLCKVDCAGLCPVCGVNLNAKQCKCPPQETDQRWAQLKKLATFTGESKKRSE